MKTKTRILALLTIGGLLCGPAVVLAQAQRPATLTIGAAAPTGACSMGRFYIRTTDSALYYCNASMAWAAFGAGLDLSAYATTAGVANGTYALAGSSLTAGVTATHDRIIVSPIAKGAGQFDGTFTSFDLTAAREWKFPDAGGTVVLQGGAFSGTTVYGTTFRSSAGIQTSGYGFRPHNASNFDISQYGWVSDQTLLSLVNGGYTLDGTVTSSQQKIKITIVDTTPSINAGDVTLCGYTTSGNAVKKLTTCESIDISGGAAVYESAGDYRTIIAIKSGATIGVLGGSGDETIAAKFANETSILTATTLIATHGPSDFVTTPPALLGPTTLATLTCADPLFCDVEPVVVTDPTGAGPFDGHTLTIIGGPNNPTGGITFTDSAGMNLSTAGAFSLDPGNVLVLIYSYENNLWVEVSRSVNTAP